MKTVTLVNAKSRDGRLADCRLRITRDPSPWQPDRHEDLIFKMGNGEIFGFKVKDTYGRGDSFICCASKAKLMEELNANNFKTDAEKDKWLKNIRDAEKKIWQCWMDGEIYGIVVEEWCESARDWKTLDCNFQLYGWDDVAEMVKEFYHRKEFKIDTYCIDEDAGDVDNMLSKYVNIVVED